MDTLANVIDHAGTILLTLDGRTTRVSDSPQTMLQRMTVIFGQDWWSGGTTLSPESAFGLTTRTPSMTANAIQANHKIDAVMKLGSVVKPTMNCERN